MTIDSQDTTSPGVAAVRRLLRLEPPTLDRDEVAELTGVPHDRSVRWWRAMGFPEVAPGEKAFRPRDVEMVERLLDLMRADIVDEDEVLRLARLMGATFSRLVEAQLDVIDEIFTSSEPGGSSRRIDIDALAAASDTDIVETLETTLLYVWRRHLLAALGRRLNVDEEGGDEVIGFVDLSGFSRVSKKATSTQIAAIIETFETVAFDVISAHEGRVVKLIGDEVMFLTRTVDDAVAIGLELVTRLAPDPIMPGVHCGIAAGPTVTVGGDVFGPTVNLAARLTDVARSGTIAMPAELLDELTDPANLDIRRVRRTYDLKGVGRTSIIAIRPPRRRA
jgi:adenylate cyclase